MCKAFESIYVATPDEEIRQVVESFGGRVIMTSDSVRRASDRVAEAAQKVNSDIIVNLQGDEVLIRPEMLEDIITALAADNNASCVNIVRKSDLTEAQDRNEVKVVSDEKGYALFMSREPIPSIWLGDKVFPYYIWLGAVAFTQASLQTYAALPSTPLEIIESIDMLRFLEHGHKIKVIETPYDTKSVDAPSDVARAEELMNVDPLYKKIDYSRKYE